MKKLAALVIIILVVLIGIVYFSKTDSVDTQIQTQEISVVQRPVVDHTSRILGLKEVLNTIGCINTTAKPFKVSLDKNHFLSFNSVVCKTQGSNDYLTTDYKYVSVKDGIVYGSIAGENKEILKYWVFENENQVHDFIVSKIKAGPDAQYCDVSLTSYGDTKEWFTEYNGPYTGNGVEPAENCGELFGLGAGAKIVFSQKNVLIQSELGTERMYKFDPESVMIK